MTITMKGLTKDFLSHVVDDIVNNHMGSFDTPGRDPTWVPLTLIADHGLSGFVAHVTGDDGGGYYVIMLMIDDPENRTVAIDDRVESISR